MKRLFSKTASYLTNLTFAPFRATFSRSGSCQIRFFFVILYITSRNYQMSTCRTDAQPELINRLKVVLVEQDRKDKWLAKQLDKNEATVSRWCSNTAQPSLEMLVKIVSILHVDPLMAIFKSHGYEINL